MDVTSASRRGKLLLIAASFIAGSVDARLGPSPPIRDTLQSIGRRLSRSCSEQELAAIASRGEWLLGRLTQRERAVLGRGYLRFQVDSPVIVDVAAPVESVPFWVADQGFHPTHLTLSNCDTSWTVSRAAFKPGWIELGVNGLDRQPVAHYIVFVRRLDGRKADPTRIVVNLDASQSSWKTTVARPHVSAAHDAHKPFEELPADLVDAVLLQPAHADRHSSLLATGRVWKTHVVSSAVPDQLTISFGPDPARALVWTWRTAPRPSSTAIRIARLPKGAQAGVATTRGGLVNEPFRVVRGESTVIEVPNLLNDPVIRRHRVMVDGLEPDTVYRYSVGDGTPGEWGPWQTVKTAPDASRGARFLYLGDAQTGLERWGRLLKAAHARHPDVDFVLLAGDLVDRGNERTNWDHFFLRAEGVFDHVPLMPCVGNHEYLDMGPRLYRAFFELPRNGPSGIDAGLVYHFECGDACFAVLDSTLAVSDPGQAQRQADWLDTTLRESAASWKFVLFHHPVYPSHPWRDTPVLRERWVPIFDKHHVDLVLQGHDHAYLRTYPLRHHRRVDGPDVGTTYVIAVSGDKFVDQPARDYIEVGRTGVSTYQTIEIDARSNRLTYRAWTEDGRILDELKLDKPRSRESAARTLAEGRSRGRKASGIVGGNRLAP
jgi:hypothetical protein